MRNVVNATRGTSAKYPISCYTVVARQLPDLESETGSSTMASSAMLSSPPVDGDTLMLHPRCNRREKSRTLLILPVSIGVGYAQHQGIIRDVSASGMFLYSNFAPPVGAEIELTLLPSTPTKRPCVAYRAIVVRLTSGVAGAAVGMGLTLNGTRPVTALQSMKAAFRLREIANQPASPLNQ